MHCSSHISFLMQYQGVNLVEFSKMIEAVVTRGTGPVVMDKERVLQKEVDKMIEAVITRGTRPVVLKKDVGLQKEGTVKKEVGLNMKKIDNDVLVTNQMPL